MTGNIFTSDRTPYFAAVAEGKVLHAHYFRAFGLNADIDNTEEDIVEPGGTYVWPVSPVQMEAVSTSPNDTLDGTGVQKLFIHYLNGSKVEESEVLNMSGLTPTPTSALDISRVLSIHTYQAGNLKQADGIISLRHTSDTPVYSRIAVGQNMSLYTNFTVPLNHTGYIKQWNVSVGNTSVGNTVRFSLKATSHLTIPYDFCITQDVVNLPFGFASINYDPPLRVPGMVDIKVTAIADTSSANAYCSSSFSGYTICDNGVA